MTIKTLQWWLAELSCDSLLGISSCWSGCGRVQHLWWAWGICHWPWCADERVNIVESHLPVLGSLSEEDSGACQVRGDSPPHYCNLWYVSKPASIKSIDVAAKSANYIKLCKWPTAPYSAHYYSCKLILQFACGLCRQLRNTSSLIHEISNIGPNSDRATAEGLMEHLALVNGHVDLATETPKLMAWAEEILSRIYALRICLRSPSTTSIHCP